MKALFIIDWIVDYISTPKMEVTPGQEFLYYLALSIIFVLSVVVCSVILKVIKWIKNK